MKELTTEQKEIQELLDKGVSIREASRIVFERDSKESTIRGWINQGILQRGDTYTVKVESLTQWTDNTLQYAGIVELQKPREFDNSRILVISDMHIPYHHPDALEFLQHLKDKHKPTRVICMGDELDKHALSYHDSDPDLSSAGDELRKSIPITKELEAMFPVMDILDSNHGSLVWRKAKTHGIPRHYIKSYNDVLGVSRDWVWHNDLTVKLPNGSNCYFHHGKTNDVIKLSQQMGMNCVQGHYHESFKVDYWGNPTGLFWGMQTACLINDKSYAFSYNNVNIKRPIIGTGLIIDSLPVLEPMLLGNDGRWTLRKQK